MARARGGIARGCHVPEKALLAQCLEGPVCVIRVTKLPQAKAFALTASVPCAPSVWPEMLGAALPFGCQFVHFAANPCGFCGLR